MLTVYKIVIQGFLIGDFSPETLPAEWPLDVLIEEMGDHHEKEATLLKTISRRDFIEPLTSSAIWNMEDND